jgi:hypothetical protein
VRSFGEAIQLLSIELVLIKVSLYFELELLPAKKRKISWEQQLPDIYFGQ